MLVTFEDILEAVMFNVVDAVAIESFVCCCIVDEFCCLKLVVFDDRVSISSLKS